MLPRLCVLVSYFYLRGDDTLSAICRALAPYVDFMWDSGAFTDHFQHRKALATRTPYERITVEAYCGWLDEWASRAWGYVQLDVLTNEQASRHNLEHMVRRGYRPMPVVTVREDPGRAGEWITISGKICVAGIGKDPLPFPQQRFWRTWNAIRGQGLIHALGFTRYPAMLQLPLHCGDSSSWLSGGRFGTVVVFDPQRGIRSVGREKMRADASIREDVATVLRRAGTPPEWFVDASRWRGKTGILRLLNAYAFLRMHAAVATTGRRLFLAAGSASDLLLLVGVLAGVQGDGQLNLPRAHAMASYLQELPNHEKPAAALAVIQSQTTWATVTPDTPPAFPVGSPASPSVP